jgi:hypothetical protein
MITKTLIGIAAMLCAMAASAQSGTPAPVSRKSPPNPAQIIERLKARMPMVKCATGAGAVADEDTTVYKLANGISYEFAHADGRITSVTAIAPGGQRMKVDAVPAPRGAPEPARTDKADKADKAAVQGQPTRAQVHLGMEKFLRAECARFAASESGEAPARGEEQLAVGTTSSAGGSMAGDWDYADFLGYSDAFSRDAFESSAADWSNYAEFAARSQQSLPRCTVVIKECSDFCGTVGQLEYSGCGGLALAAGFTLGPPTGAAVGFYCTGNVYLATEQCRSRCQTPAVVCSW